MKARCDWCGVPVEVLSDGKCLLGHPVKRANRLPLAPSQPLPPRPPAMEIAPSGGRVRTRMVRTDRRPKAPRLGEARLVARSSVATVTATRPRVTDPPTVIKKPPTSRPKAGDGPTEMPKRTAATARTARPAAKTAVRSPVAKPATKPAPAKRPVPKPAAEVTKIAPASRARPAPGRTVRKWVPVDPFGPSGPVEISLEEPKPEPAEPTAAVAAVAPLAAEASPVTASAAEVRPSGAAARAAAERAAASVAGAMRSVDWRSGAERARDASIAVMRRAGGAVAASAAATGRAGRAVGSAVTGIDYRAIGKRFGPLSPQNPVMWVAGLAIAGIALVVGLLSSAPSKSTQVLGQRVAAAAELTQVPGYTVEDDPATEAEVSAQQPTAKKVSAANVRDGNKVVARYQAIAFGPEVRWTPDAQRQWLALYARGAGVTPDAFVERTVGSRAVWSAPLGNGLVAILFADTEIVVIVAGQSGAGADTVIDAVLGARGL